MTLADMITRALCAHLSPEDAEDRATKVAEALKPGDDEKMLRAKIWDELGRFDLSERVPLKYREEMVNVIYMLYKREAQHGTDGPGRPND